MKKQRVIFYLPEKAIFDATQHYCFLIGAAFERFKNCELKVVQSLEDLSQNDILITIRLFDAFDSKVKPKKHIHWFQGVAPEEKRMLANYTLKSRISSLKTAYYERKILKRADLCFFVSEKMKEHYKSKYLLRLDKKAVIMPCYNLQLDEQVFFKEDRYNKASFVYAGSTAQWQCLDETLLIFKAIQERIIDAELVVLTKDYKTVEELIKKYRISNVKINYVDLSELQNELSKYKYAFLIREDCVVNNVATPTKMNSYLSAGLIPVYTSVVDSFESNINLQEFTLKFRNQNYSEIATKIVEFDNQVLDISKLFKIYQRLFDSYYNDETYIDLISNKIKSIILDER